MPYQPFSDAQLHFMEEALRGTALRNVGVQLIEQCRRANALVHLMDLFEVSVEGTEAYNGLVQALAAYKGETP